MHRLRTKIALGTVQFGLNYGINNKTGKITSINDILDYALANNINTLDTAQSYGDSEIRIGEYNSHNQFNIISKITPEENISTEDSFLSSLRALKSDSIYGLLIHDFSTFKKNKHILKSLQQLKDKGKIKKIGFSLYSPFELKYLLENNIEFDIIQVPYNIFDQRFEPYFKKLKNLNIEIHTRSVFLQGLFFIPPNELSEHFLDIKKHLTLLNKLAIKHNHTIASLCLAFAISNTDIDKIVIGIDSIDNLKENLSSLHKISDDLKTQLLQLSLKNENILLPMNWKR